MPAQSKFLSKLAGKRILVIGGTSGIGFAVAEACLEHGAHVTVAGSSPEKLARALARLEDAYPGARVRGATADLGHAEQLEENLTRLMQAAAEDGKVSHVVFTAGNPLQVVHVRESDMTYLRDVCTVRFLAPMVLAKVAPGFMVEGREASVTFTGGTNSSKPMPGWGVMAAYGAGLEGLVRGMATDLKPLRFNLVEPGLVLTEMTHQIPEAVVEEFKKQTLAGEAAMPEDVAEAYLWFMKDRFVTGAVAKTDGGRLLV